MTWKEYYNMLVERGAAPDLASMSIGHMMDDYESYDWDDKVPFDVEE